VEVDKRQMLGGSCSEGILVESDKSAATVLDIETQKPNKSIAITARMCKMEGGKQHA